MPDFRCNKFGHDVIDNKYSDFIKLSSENTQREYNKKLSEVEVKERLNHYFENWHHISGRLIVDSHDIAALSIKQKYNVVDHDKNLDALRKPFELLGVGLYDIKPTTIYVSSRDTHSYIFIADCVYFRISNFKHNDVYTLPMYKLNVDRITTSNSSEVQLGLTIESYNA